MGAEEVDERSHDRVEETALRPKRGFELFFIHHGIRALRFLRKPGREHSNGHSCAVDTVGHAPADARCHNEDEGIRGQERDSIPELLRDRDEALFFSAFLPFNSPPLNHNPSLLSDTPTPEPKPTTTASP